jgi:hypothetical protein
MTADTIETASPLGMVGLIQAVGDDHIQFQALAECMISVNAKRGHGEITFGTTMDKCAGFALGESSQYVGLVVWLPRDRLPLMPNSGLMAGDDLEG